LKPASYQKRVFQDLQGLKKSQKVNLTWEFWDVAALKKKKAGAFLAVAAADLGQGAGILRAHYKPKEKSRGRFALVGKGLCFDTGGYNIKTGTHMQGMHQDMIGSAVALETFKLLVQENQPYELVLWMALAENHISPQGFKANDLVMSASGLSIEVVDTDAEGRMVLADALYFASGDEPTAIFDFATLTGACVRSLDTRRSGVFSNKREWLQRCVDVGERVGERLCSFPIDFDDFDSLRSEVADLKQCADHNNCDHIFAAAFLSRFVKESPWIHVDLSSGRNKGGLGLMPHATTGFGVRWTCQMIKELGR
jgi:leucyl aminopeptidase